MHRWLSSAVAIGAGALLVTSPLAAAPAAAAGHDILLSQDGTTWTTSLSRNVFDTSRMMVPGDSLQGSFYVKNDRDVPAYLRVGLSALSVTDWTLAQALSLTTIGTGPSGASGTAAGFAGPGVVCSDLLQREDPLPPGGVVLVSADLLFRASTSGTTAQGEIAQIAFVVELSDVDLNAVNQPLCTNTARIGPPDPTLVPTPGVTVTPGGGSGGTGGTGTAGGTGAGSAGSPGGSSPGTTTGGRDAAGGGSAGDPTGPRAFERPAAAGTIAVEGVIGLDGSFFNTVRWCEEYAILLLIGAALLGMLGRVAAAKWLAERERGTRP